MPYIPYATEVYYESGYGGSLIPGDSLRRLLIQASRHIDTLTYNRIVGRGFDNLTEFQKNVIQEVGSLIPGDSLRRLLIQASRHIDTLTYNRIVGRGFDNLTEFQKNVIQEVVCRQAEFEYENADEISSVLSSYSINGVSAQFGEISSVLSSYSINGVSAQFGSSWNVFTDRGIAMKRDDYALLCQTGLCCGLLR